MKKFTHQIKNLWLSNTVFLNYIIKHHGYIFFIHMLSIVLSGFSAAVLSKTSKIFIDSILVGKNLSRALSFVIFWMCYMLIMNVAQHFASTYSNVAYSYAQVLVKEEFTKKVVNLRPSYFDVPRNRDILARATTYSENGGSQLMNYFFSLLTNIVAVISIVYVLTPFAWWITLFLIVLTLYKTCIEIIVSKKNYEFHKEKTLLNRKISYFGSILTEPNQILDINIYNAFSFFFGKYKELQYKNIELTKKQSIKINLLNIIALFSVVVQNVVLYFYIGTELLRGNISVSDFTLFFTAVNYFNTILSNFRKSISQLVPMSLEAQNYYEFLNTPPEYQYKKNNPIFQQDSSKVIINDIKSVEFRNVYFRYPMKNEDVLQNITFKIKAGEIVSLVGMNGSGKTTIIKLLLGFYMPSSGKIYINSIPLEKIDIFSYWRCCGLMLQQFNIYAMSAYENITFSKDVCEIKKILELVSLNQVFEKQKNGVNTELSKRFDQDGLPLSGGEQQKVVFSRLIFHQKEAIFLDEPSSSLDAKAENELFSLINNFHDNGKAKIVLFVSHRLSSSTCADKIIFIKNGELIFEGKHNELMEKCADYRQMFLMQANKYLEEGG